MTSFFALTSSCDSPSLKYSFRLHFSRKASIVASSSGEGAGIAERTLSLAISVHFGSIPIGLTRPFKYDLGSASPMDLNMAPIAIKK